MRPERAIHILILGLILFAALRVWNSDSSRKFLIESDGKGYYAYLPAIFIYQDLGFHFIEEVEERYYPGQTPVFFHLETDAGRVNKYYVGVSVLMLPFFLIAHFLSLIGGMDTGGYSPIYLISIATGTLFYLYLGLRFLSSFMRNLGFKNWAIAASLLLIVLATNLLYYSTIEASMSHAYSFFGIASFMLAAQRAIKQKRLSVAMGVSFGLILLIRPTNVLAIFLLPFLAGSWSNLISWFRSVFGSLNKAVLPVFLGLAVIGIQLLIYKIQTGNWIVFSYGGEGFDFTDPEFYNVLFSFRKGWFVYTPIALVSLFGIATLAKRNLAMAVSSATYIGASIYLISSWWDWSYGGSFGHRAFIDTYPVIAVLMGSLLSAGSGWVAWGIAVISFAVFMPVNLIQTFQYRTGILPTDHNTKNWYSTVFLKTDMYLVGQFAMLNQPEQSITDSFCSSHRMEEKLGWGNEHELTTDLAHTGTSSAYMGKKEMYGVTFNATLKQLNVDSANAVSFKCWVNSEGANSKALMVLSIADSAGNNLFWEAYPIVVQIDRSNEWIIVEKWYEIPMITAPTTTVSAYLMKEGGPSLYYDEMEICLGVSD